MQLVTSIQASDYRRQGIECHERVPLVSLISNKHIQATSDEVV
jgi:hypothetical protein